MLEELKRQVCDANIALQRHNLAVLTWGNVSAISREHQLVVIKPSGVPYEVLKPEDMVVVRLDGTIVEGSLKPSVDLPTHLVLYAQYPNIGAVVHDHSTYATSYAQAQKEIPCYGTTQADTFHGSIPCTALLEKDEVKEDYTRNTGLSIVRRFAALDVVALPGCLVASHGVFAWGKDPAEAVNHAVVIEQCAKMAFLTETLDPQVKPIPTYYQDSHYERKHGPHSTYGQEKK